VRFLRFKLILKPIYSATCNYNARKLIFQQGGHDLLWPSLRIIYAHKCTKKLVAHMLGNNVNTEKKISILMIQD